MKKFTTIFAVMVMVTLFTVTAYAGPLDWIMDKIGYTPTSVYETQIQQTEKALAAAKAANEAAKQLASTAAFQESVITYGGLGVLVLGGLAFLRRKSIAEWNPSLKKATPTV
jgi:MYXO-CTERM domain-containing protein